MSAPQHHDPAATGIAPGPQRSQDPARAGGSRDRRRRRAASVRSGAPSPARPAGATQPRRRYGSPARTSRRPRREGRPGSATALRSSSSASGGVASGTARATRPGRRREQASPKGTRAATLRARARPSPGRDPPRVFVGGLVRVARWRCGSSRPRPPASPGSCRGGSAPRAPARRSRPGCAVPDARHARIDDPALSSTKRGDDPFAAAYLGGPRSQARRIVDQLAARSPGERNGGGKGGRSRSRPPTRALAAEVAPRCERRGLEGARSVSATAPAAPQAVLDGGCSVDALTG